MKTTLTDHLLWVAASTGTGGPIDSGNGPGLDSFYLDAMNIATEAYDGLLPRLGFCYRTIKTAHDMRRQSASSKDLSDEATNESALHEAMLHLRSIATFGGQSMRYALLRLWRNLKQPVVGGGFSFAHMATACIALVVIAGVWLPSRQPIDETDAPYRGVKPVSEATSTSPPPAQISLSVLMLNALTEEAGLGDHVNIVAGDSAIDINGGLDDAQFEIWNSQVLSEYKKRGGVETILNQTIDRL